MVANLELLQDGVDSQCFANQHKGLPSDIVAGNVQSLEFFIVFYEACNSAGAIVTAIIVGQGKTFQMRTMLW